jgi:hypothetical protein
MLPACAVKARNLVTAAIEAHPERYIAQGIALAYVSQTGAAFGG